MVYNLLFWSVDSKILLRLCDPVDLIAVHFLWVRKNTPPFSNLFDSKRLTNAYSYNPLMLA